MTPKTHYRETKKGVFQPLGERKQRRTLKNQGFEQKENFSFVVVVK